MVKLLTIEEISKELGVKLLTVKEASKELGVTKATIYYELKKFEKEIVEQGGKKYITEHLLNLIKKDLNIIDEVCLTKNIDDDLSDSVNPGDSSLGCDDNKDDLLVEVVKATDAENFKEVLCEENVLGPIKSKDIQLQQKDSQIAELHKLIENTQILLKNQQEISMKQIEYNEKISNKESSISYEQLREKDKQIARLHGVIENLQEIMKEEQKKSDRERELEKHFEEVDKKIIEVKAKLDERRRIDIEIKEKKEEESVFSKIFGKKKLLK